MDQKIITSFNLVSNAAASANLTFFQHQQIQEALKFLLETLQGKGNSEEFKVVGTIDNNLKS